MAGKIKISVVGLGGRGFSLLKEVILQMEDVEVLGICNSYEDRAKRGFDEVKAIKGNTPVCSLDYRDVIVLEEIDGVVISAAWEQHIQIAVEAMRAGKYVGVEVGGAYSIDDCWQLVRTSEQTGIPCMMLENCCYGQREMMALNMVRQGIFGEIVHCKGRYFHDLRSEILTGVENRHYRYRNYLNRNCDNYPTHALGPIAKILDIGRGNRMMNLTSVASKAAGLHQYIAEQYGEDAPMAKLDFKQGDIVMTTIQCARGETISLMLDTTPPRAYSRGFTVRGTKGFYQEETHSVYLAGEHDGYENDWSSQWGNAEEYKKKYNHPLWVEFEKNKIRGGSWRDGLVDFQCFL